ncbi:hypothetical protein FIBSPDRAFT_113225 [Athelia psychrophila]|uniref:Uncharacterized protein n=1 Tax=Athelia psychrophila TaxID=1759441 RepID=A0A166TIB6_9AGAM|nr:hypothetical protein FIBSPDRAFT_113225 [Fibularhizoctonia sp. CBS 109695]
MGSVNDRPQAHLVHYPALPTHETMSTVDFPVSRFGRLASASRTPPITFQNTHDPHAPWQRRILSSKTPKGLLHPARCSS